MRRQVTEHIEETPRTLRWRGKGRRKDTRTQRRNTQRPGKTRADRSKSVECATRRSHAYLCFVPVFATLRLCPLGSFFFHSFFSVGSFPFGLPGMSTLRSRVAGSVALCFILQFQVLAQTGALPVPSGSQQPAPRLPEAPPPIAPDYRAPLRPLPSGERVGVEGNQQAPVSLEEAIRLALSNNNDIDSARADVRIAEQDLKAAHGAYDPQLFWETYYERRMVPIASAIGGAADGRLVQKDLVGSAQLSGLSPKFGGSYRFGFSSSRSDTNNQFTSLNPQFPSSLTVSFTQPLLRGLRTDDERRRLAVAKKNLTLTDEQFRQRVMDIITRVEEAYWDLVFALRDIQVQLDAVKQARAQVESNRRQVEQGVLAPIDVVAAETQVATFEQSVYTAQEAVTRAENALKVLLLPDRTHPLWSRALLPTTDVTRDPPRVDLNEAVSVALANRPEVKQVETTEEINRINIDYFKDRTKPQIDLVGAYSAVGLAGRSFERGANPFSEGNAQLLERVNQLSVLAGLATLPPPAPLGAVPEELIGGLNRSLSNLFGLGFTTVRAGLRFSLPLRNRSAEAGLGRSLAEGRKIENRRRHLRQSIEAEVRNSLQSVRSAEARLAAAASARSSADQQYESERRRFEAGLSTVFLVLERQTQLVAARGSELEAQTDLNKAIAGLRRVTGEILGMYNIRLVTTR